MEMNFCRRCGQPLVNTRNHIYICPNNHTIYANSSPTVGIFFIAADGQILLSRRAIEPMKGLLDSVGGFVDGGETLEAAAAREITEELGLQATDYDSLHYLCSSTGMYEFAGEFLPILNVFYWTSLGADAKIQPQDDISEVVKIRFDTDPRAVAMDEQIKVGLRCLLEKRSAHEI